jgi:hypothetical protein
MTGDTSPHSIVLLLAKSIANFKELRYKCRSGVVTLGSFFHGANVRDCETKQAIRFEIKATTDSVTLATILYIVCCQEELCFFLMITFSAFFQQFIYIRSG